MSDVGNNQRNPRGLWREWFPGVVAFITGISLVVLLRKPGGLWIHVSWLQYLAVPVAVAGIIFFWRWRQLRKDGVNFSIDRSTFVAFGLLASLMIFVISSATNDMWFFFLRWGPSGGPESYPLVKSGVVRFSIIVTLLMPVLLFCRTKVSIWVITLGVLLWSQVTCFSHLWNVTGGQALYNDDHPSLMYRLWVYAQTFPGLIYYDPLWNGGKEASYLVSTGVIPLGTILLPLWKLFSVDQIYTPALALAFIVIIPLLAGFSVRFIGGSWIAACCASIMALGISQYFFLWMLHFGTVGSCFALPFIMLVCACLYRVFWLEHLDGLTGSLLVLSSLMFLAWPPSAIMAVFMLPAVMAGMRQWSVRKIAFLVVCGIVLIVLLVPSVVGIMSHADPMGFVQAGTKKMEVSHCFRHGWGTLCDHFRQGNPCLVFLGILGLWFMPQKGMKVFYGVSIIGLALLAGWGDTWKPLLQLSRTGIPLMFVAVTPAAILMGKWLENVSVKMIPVRAVVIALLLLSGLNSARFYGNKWMGPYVTMSPEMEEITTWLKSNVSQNERVLFAGMTVHSFGRGHVAYLPVLTGREMMACDYFHFSTKKVEYDYPPKAFRSDDRHVMDFMNLYNVGYILTYHDTWKKFFRKYPVEYEEIKSFGEKKKRTVFKVKRTPNQFLKGSGSVRAGINELHVKVDNPFEEAVLRYNWVDGLSADAPVEIKPVEVDKDIRFIVVNPHGKAEFKVLYRKWL
ncbi:MAG: hypothetical protein PHR77_06340 [Kiritimatiellae bacterium]|nr:hypothetical protein [Kiritimatiellia bacterium]MDD5522653.1 hypothetical protein [Kiritimatiellia bacterium]